MEARKVLELYAQPLSSWLCKSVKALGGAIKKRFVVQSATAHKLVQEIALYKTTLGTLEQLAC